MKREIVIATRNAKKFKEIKRLFRGSGLKVLSLNKFSNIPDVVEDGKRFEDNAVKKALTVSSHTERLVLADDSGLEVHSLGGEPGVFSARYAGPKKDDRRNNLKLLRVLKNKSLKKRKARFRCAAAIADKGRLIKAVEGISKGRIGIRMEGKTGFGYDPVFIPNGYKKTFAALGPRIKDRLSHRAKAVRKAKRFIEGYLSKAP